MSFHVSFCICVFSPYGVAITSLGEERANLSAFRTFVRFVFVWICRFPLPLEGLGKAAVCDCGTPWTFLLPFFSLKLLIPFHNGYYCTNWTHVESEDPFTTGSPTF